MTPGQLAVVAAAATAAHAAFLGVNTFVVHHLQLGGNDAPESYLYEGSAFDEEAHKAQGAKSSWPRRLDFCLTFYQTSRRTGQPLDEGSAFD